MKVLITGRPQSGKTTLCKKVFHFLQSKITIGGMITEEIRENNRRMGFKLIDLISGKTGILAHVNIKGRKIGKYYVNIENLENIGIKALERAENSDLIIIDEIGPMELLSRKFNDKVIELFSQKRDILATIHYRIKHPIKNMKDVEIYFLNEKNREQITFKVIKKFGC